MVRRALQPLVPEVPGLAAADDGPSRHRDLAEGLAGLEPRHDPGDVRGEALGQVAGLGAGVGDGLLAVAVVELLRHRERLLRRPAEARSAELLQGGQVVQPRRRLPLLLHLDRERALEAVRPRRDRFRAFALQDLVLGRVPHLEAAGLHLSGRHHLEVGLRLEGADLELAPADDGERRRLHPADADHRAPAAAQGDGGGAGEREVVDLVGLLPGDRGAVEPGVFAIRLGRGEGLADRLRVLGGEHHPPDLAAVAAVLQDLLADQLALAVAVGGEPDPLGALERVADRLELGSLVAAGGGLGAVEPVGAQQHGRPALPGRRHLLGLEQRQQVAFGGEDGAEARADRGADVLGLAGLLGDDEVVGHGGRGQRWFVLQRVPEDLVGPPLRGGPSAPGREAISPTAGRRPPRPRRPRRARRNRRCKPPAPAAAATTCRVALAEQPKRGLPC